MLGQVVEQRRIDSRTLSDAFQLFLVANNNLHGELHPLFSILLEGSLRLVRVVFRQKPVAIDKFLHCFIDL